MGAMSFVSAMAKARTPRRDTGRREERRPSGVLSALRSFRGSAYPMGILFCCVLLAMVVAVSRGWAAHEEWAPSRACSYPEGVSEADLGDSIVMAVAGPLKTEKGEEMVKATRLRIEEANDGGGIAGKRVVLMQCDDGIEAGASDAEREARWKVVAGRIADSEALAVVGHRSSNASIVAGGVYRERRIPVISGTALADEVTAGNAWYFRTVPHTSHYMENLVHYANKVLNYKRIGIIHAGSPFEHRLRMSFSDSLRSHGVEKAGEWGLPMQESEWAESIPSILRELEAKAPDAVFLAIDDENAPPVLEAIKRNGINIPILGGAILSKTSFPLLFADLPEEKQKPGYFTDGIIAPAYFMFDIAGRDADEFVDRYEKRFPGYKASTGAISTYDAAGLAIRAIGEAYVHGKNRAERRANIKEYISGLNKDTGNYYEGAMGKVYFDEEGNSIRGIPIALISNRQIISAPIQIAEITDPRELDMLKRKVAHQEFDGSGGLVFKMRSGDELAFFNRINAVYSGVRINGITDIDAGNLTYDLDAHLWFRFDKDPNLDIHGEEDREGKVDVEYLGNIEFLNAIGEIEVTKEKSQESGERMGDLGYSLYRIKGRFGALFNPEFYTHGERTLELNFRHRNLPREKLIFVQDILSIYEFGDDYLNDREIKRQILNPSTGWEIRKITHHLDIMDVPTLGDPKLFGKKSDEVAFSRHNSNITIREIGISMFGFSPSNFLLHLMALGILIGVLFILYLRHWKYLRSNWLSNPIVFVILLILAELSILNWNADSMNLSYLNFVTKFTGILWWIVLGMILSFATKVFMFAPLEEKTGRKIPTIIPRMTAFTIYLFMLFGVTAFVFDYKVTSLLATSGLLAMILGLAVQSNLSNIFSGIALNLEHPFRIGDWVRIADFDEGKVINVTWRSVRIRTPDNHIISIPNSMAAETVAHNFTPHPEKATKKGAGRIDDKKFILGLTIQAHPEEEPARIKGLLEEIVGKVAREDRGILLEPKPVIRFLGIGEHSAGGYAAQYEVMVSIKDYEKKKLHRDNLWRGIWEQLNEAGCLHSAFAG
uniref:ABC-type branched-chain amino acid transport system, substrate-binding protein n=1 Tax=Candidatus Kentrum sp. SD TaxID=2126332 RepID=A0A451BJ10_9GAMM|nr:MAG: ABC-type branched-chain amino acid transport system, substrate-binding protein [Candidatus Kentron sp. SD]